MDKKEQLRADIELHKRYLASTQKDIDKLELQLAALEAEEAENADPWRETKRNITRWEEWVNAINVSSVNRDVVSYVRHLEAENKRLEAELAKRPVHSTVLERLKSMAAQHACGCGHPACKRCEDDRLNKDAIEGASK